MERNDLIERVRALLADEAADFEADLVAASETGERIDLDAREIDVPVDWLHRLLATIERLTAEKEEAERRERHRIFRLLWDHSAHVGAYPLGLLIKDDASVTKALPPRALSQGGEHG